jgi:hypothetical protein
VHQADDALLGGLELAESGNQPAHGDDRVLYENGYQPTSLEPESANRANGLGRRYVRTALEHGDITDHGAGPDPTDDTLACGPGSIELDLASLNDERCICVLALSEQVCTGVFVDI